MTTFISIHALREEGDSIAFAPLAWQSYFYPRPPRGGRLACVTTLLNCGDFYPRPPRGGRHIFRQSLAYLIPISIHALREEGDPSHPPHLPLPAISIHALREEGDPSFFDRRYHNGRFLSTPSARRATKLPPRKRSSQKNFYPRPPRGGRLSTKGIPAAAFRFLSTPSARRATSAAGTEGLTVAFLSTPSARRATVLPSPARGEVEISIHALREEGDQNQQRRLTEMTEFLSTPSARRATRCG